MYFKPFLQWACEVKALKTTRLGLGTRAMWLGSGTRTTWLDLSSQATGLGLDTRTTWLG